MARYAFALLAEKTVDVQYYIWEGDATGRILLSALIGAADRGVRVRVLLDDMYTSRRDEALAVLAAHPNIDVRLYNPFGGRSFRLWDALFNFSRITHRMHNKAFIVDNAAAIVGGRNIGDNYFSVHAQSNYRDLDLFAVGPVVREVSHSFDTYWNSAWAFPMRAFVPEQPTKEEFYRRTDALKRFAAHATDLPFNLDLNTESLHTLIQRVPEWLIWGAATMLADDPDKPETAQPGVLPALRLMTGESLHTELLLEVAYFVPGEKGVERLCSLVARGVRIRILTNSFASNDVLAAHAGYASYRHELVRCGVEVAELQPEAGFIKRRWTWLRGKSTAGLHTKAAVFDRRAVFIGSFNMDPRSAYLNTELAIIVESPALAATVAHFMEEGMEPDNAYHVQSDQAGNLMWIAETQGGTVRFPDEPHMTCWGSLAIGVLSLLPIEGQL
jgi:putative cardiolipin synthase